MKKDSNVDDIEEATPEQLKQAIETVEKALENARQEYGEEDIYNTVTKDNADSIMKEIDEL